MTLMTLNLGYGIGISPKQRHKRHLRHYRHARTVPGVWGTPQKCVCGYPNAMLAKHVYPPKKNDSTQPRCPYKFVYPQSESPVIHPKILTRKSESVLIHSAQINGNPLFIKKSTKIFLNSTQGYRKSWWTKQLNQKQKSERLRTASEQWSYPGCLLM